MPDREARRYLVVASGDDPELLDALRAVRAETASGEETAEVVVLVDDPAGAAAIRERVSAATRPGGPDVRTVVAADPAASVRERAAGGGVDRVLVTREAGVRTDAFADLDVPVDRVPEPASRSRRPIVRERSLGGFVLTFLGSYAFYLLLGSATDPFDLATGAITAGVVAAALSSVAFAPRASIRRTAARTARATAFLPYLGYEVVRANLAVAAVILRPSLPIDPELVRREHSPESEPFERAVLANAITLTPGTVTVDVDDEGLSVHALTAESRAGFERGSLARAVSWVCHGSDGR